MIYISLVVYDSSEKDIELLNQSLKKIKSPFKLWVVDNSLSKKYKKYFLDFPNLSYIVNCKNLGFGASHNIVLQNAINNNVPYVFVINPDIHFYQDVSVPILEYMDANIEVGLLMPNILKNDGSRQNLPKLFPTPFLAIARKFRVFNSLVADYEFENLAINALFESPNISGCFTVIRTEIFKKIGMYDPQYFIYFEDWDLSLRTFFKYKTVFFPQVSIYHSSSSGNNRSLKKSFHKACSFVKFFNKWGWFNNSLRKKVNAKVLSSIEYIY